MFRHLQNLFLNRTQQLVMNNSTTQEDENVPKTKQEEKKENKKIQLKRMKKWSEEHCKLVPYPNLINPLKEIIKKGYRIIRYKNISNFEYDGYNIGKPELSIFPPPNFGFTQKILELEEKNGNTLLDVVLRTSFLLGVEQGRRAEKSVAKPYEDLTLTLEEYRRSNLDLQSEIDEKNAIIEELKKTSSISNEDIKNIGMLGANEKRLNRIKYFVNELKKDKSKNINKLPEPLQKADFKDLMALAKHLDTDSVSIEDWKKYLEENGWSIEEWQFKCQKKDKSI